MRGIPKIQYKQEQEEVDAGDNKKVSETIQREFYMCFCSKKYHSYSALYLHVKKVHGRPLNMKCLRIKSHQWSGSVKNVFYEFHEEDSSQQEKGSKGGEQILKVKKNRKVRSLQVKNKATPEERQNVKEEGIYPSEKRSNFHVENSILKVLTFYKESFLMDPKNISFLHLIDQLMAYMNKNYRDFDELANCVEYCSEQTCERVPYAFNPFYMKHFPGPTTNDEVIFQLSGLASWIHHQKFSTFLAVDSRIYEQMWPDQLIKQQ